MAISIKGVNTGVIRKSNNFIALALKIKEGANKRGNSSRLTQSFHF
ncbi:YjeJ family protein, partial [Escherichia coli]